MLNYTPLTPLRNLKSNFVGMPSPFWCHSSSWFLPHAIDKFVALRGNVVRVSSIKPLVTSMAFDCPRCGNRTTVKFSGLLLRMNAFSWLVFLDGRYNPPSACEGKCKNKFMNPDRKSATNHWLAKDKVILHSVAAHNFNCAVRIQEIVSSEQVDQGRIPRTIEVGLCFVPSSYFDCSASSQRTSWIAVFLEMLLQSLALWNHARLDAMHGMLVFFVCSYMLIVSQTVRLQRED